MFPLLITHLALAHPLSNGPVVMSGTTAEWTTTVAVDDPGAVSARLVVSASDRLDVDASTLSVRVDGVPVRTLSVAQLVQDGTGVIALPMQSAGYHRVEFVSHLVVPGDPCLAHDPEAAWLVLAQQSALQGVRGDGPVGSVADVVASWRQEDGVYVDSVGTGADEATVLLEAADWLVRRGTRPGNGRGKTLHLRDLTNVDVPPDLRQRLMLVESADSVIGIVEDDVWVVGRDSDTLASGLWTFNQPGVVEACTELLCTVGGERAEVLNGSHSLDATVWTGEGPWGPSGRVLSGAGHHTTRWTVARSRSWTLDEAPVVVLDITLPHAGVLSRESAALLTVKGRPIGSWSLSGDDTARRWVARIPYALWDESEWTFELQVVASTEDADACAVDNDRGVFVVLEPTSRVEVVRTERLTHGLAAFSRATEHSRPMVAWNAELASVDWLQAGVLLSGVASRTPADRWLVSSEPHSPHVEIAAPTSPWLDIGEWVPLPQLVANESPLLFADDCLSGRCERLVVTVGVDAVDVPVPDLSQMPTAGAVWTDSWVALDDGSVGDSTVVVTFGLDPDSLAVQPSEEQSHAGLVNLVTGILSVLLLIVGGLWTARGRIRH